MNKLRAAAYCRVSTDRAEQSGSLASQRSFFDDYIRNSDSMTLVGVFYDEGTSGTTTLNRYGFNKMISLAVSGGIDIILSLIHISEPTRPYAEGEGRRYYLYK